MLTNLLWLIKSIALNYVLLNKNIFIKLLFKVC